MTIEANSLSLRTVPSRPEIERDPLAILKIAEDESEALYIFAHEPRVWWAYFLDIELEWFQTEFILAAERYHRLLGLWPAGFGKSTNMSYGYPLWHIARNRNVRINQIGKTGEEMDAYALQERNTLEKNEKLREWYGHFRSPDPSARRLQMWSGAGVNVEGREIDDPHNTLEWFGSNSDNALGHRCDIFIIDDVVTPETAATHARRSKLSYRFHEQWKTSPQYRFRIKPTPVTPWPVTDPEDGSFWGYLQVPEGITWPVGIEYEKIIVVGTTFHAQDLYNELRKDHTFHYLRHDCFVRRADGVIDSLWPERWPMKKLESEKKSNLPAFMRRFRNICTSSEDLAFKEIYFTGGEEKGRVYPGCLDKERSFGDRGKDWRVYCAIDPASGTRSTDAAQPAIVVAGYDPKDKLRKRYLIDIWAEYVSYHGILGAAIHMHDLYEYGVLVVEKNAFATWLLDEDEPQIQELKRRGVRIIDHTTGRNKLDPDWGVRSMEPFIMDGLWSLPYKMPSDETKLESYYEEFRLYPQGLTDFIMATWFIDLQIRKGHGGGGAFKPKGRKIYTRRNIAKEIDDRRKRREELERSKA